MPITLVDLERLRKLLEPGEPPDIGAPPLTGLLEIGPPPVGRQGFRPTPGDFELPDIGGALETIGRAISPAQRIREAAQEPAFPSALRDVPVIGGATNVISQAAMLGREPGDYGRPDDILNALPGAGFTSFIPTVTTKALPTAVKLGLGVLGEDVIEPGARAIGKAAEEAVPAARRFAAEETGAIGGEGIRRQSFKEYLVERGTPDIDVMDEGLYGQPLGNLSQRRRDAILKQQKDRLTELGKAQSEYGKLIDDGKVIDPTERYTARPPAPSGAGKEIASLRRRADELEGLANRGMKVRAYKQEAAKLRAQADALAHGAPDLPEPRPPDLPPAGGAELPPQPPAAPPEPPRIPPTGDVTPPDLPVGPQSSAENVLGLRRASYGLSKWERGLNRVRAILRQPQTHEAATPILQERKRLGETVRSQSAAVGAEFEARLYQVFDVDDSGIINGLDATIQDVAAQLPRYLDRLTPEQRAFMIWARDTIAPYRGLWDEVQEQAGTIVGRKAKELNTRGDIIDGGFYLPRGRAALEGADEPIKVAVPRGAVGGGGGFKRAATFDSMAEGIRNGYEYSYPGEAISSYIRQIGSDTVDRFTANQLVDLTDAQGVRIAQSAADRVDPKLRDAAAALALKIRSTKESILRIGATGRRARVTTEQAQRVSGGQEKLADTQFEALLKRMAGQDSETILREAEKELLAAAELKKRGLLAKRNELQAELLDLRGRLQRARDIAASTPRERGRIGLVQLQGYDFPDAMANAANKIILEEMREINPSAIARVTNTLNGIYRLTTSTADDSAVMIQGLLGWAKDPKASSLALRTNTKAILDPQAYGARVADFNNRAAQEGLPTLTEWTKYGLHQGGNPELRVGYGLSEEAAARLRTLPILEQADRIFAVYGDTLRASWAQSELRNIVKHTGKSLDELIAAGTLDEIATTVNNMTGFSPNRFGGSLGDFVLYAPRFFQARLATVANAGRGAVPTWFGIVPEASLRQRLAADSMRNLIFIGGAMTFAANAALGEETDIRPVIADGHGGWKRNANFMRVRFGGRDWSFYGSYDSILGLVLTAATGKGVDAFRQVASSGVVSMSWDLIAGSTVIGERTRDTKEHLLRYLADSFSPFSLQESAGGVVQTAAAALQRDIGGAATGIALTLGELVGGKSAPLSYSDIQQQVVGEIIAESQTRPDPYAADTTYADLNQADKRRVQNDPRLTEIAAKFEEAPIEDETMVRIAIESLDKRRAKLIDNDDPREYGLKQKIQAGMTGSALREAIQETKSASYQASAAIFNDDVKAALDRLRKKGKTPARDVLAQMWLDVPLLQDPQTGEMNFTQQKEKREAVMRLVRALGISEEYVTGKGPDSFRAQRIEDPVVLRVLEDYERDQETLRPYWELEEEVGRTIPAIAQLRQMADTTTNPLLKQRVESKINQLLAPHKKLMRFKNNRAVDKAGLKWGYFTTPLVP